MNDVMNLATETMWIVKFLEIKSLEESYPLQMFYLTEIFTKRGFGFQVTISSMNGLKVVVDL